MEKFSYNTAIDLIHAIMEQARQDGGRPVSIAIADDHGDPMAVGRMDGATTRSAYVAMNKAFTAIYMGRDTHVWREHLEKNRFEPYWFGDPRLTPLPGAVRIVEGESAIAAIAISGRSAEDDLALCRWGLDYLKKKAGR